MECRACGYRYDKRQFVDRDYDIKKDFRQIYMSNQIVVKVVKIEEPSYDYEGDGYVEIELYICPKCYTVKSDNIVEW